MRGPSGLRYSSSVHTSLQFSKLINPVVRRRDRPTVVVFCAVSSRRRCPSGQMRRGCVRLWRPATHQRRLRTTTTMAGTQSRRTGLQSGVFACFLKGRSGEGSGMTASRSMHGWWRREREQQRRHQSQSASALESPPRRPSMSLCLLGRHGQKGGCLSVNRLMSLQWAGTRWPTRRGASYLGGQRMKMPSASGWRGLLRRHGRSRMWSSRSVASKHMRAYVQACRRCATSNPPEDCDPEGW